MTWSERATLRSQSAPTILAKIQNAPRVAGSRPGSRYILIGILRCSAGFPPPVIVEKIMNALELLLGLGGPHTRTRTR